MPTSEQFKPNTAEEKILLSVEELAKIKNEIAQIFLSTELVYATELAQTKGLSQREYLDQLKNAGEYKSVKELKALMIHKKAEAALQIKKEANLPDDKFKEAIMEGLGKYLADFVFTLPTVPKNKDNALDIFSEHLVNQFLKVKEELHIEEGNFIQEVKYKAWQILLQKELEKAEGLDFVINIITKFNLPVETYIQPIKEKLIEYLKVGGKGGDQKIFYQAIDDAIKIKNSLPMFDEIIKKDDECKECLKIAFMSADFFRLDLVLKIANNFDLPSDYIAQMDESFSGDVEMSDMIGYIKFLGKDDMKKILPKCLKVIEQKVSEKLPQNEDLADYFLENLENYYQEPWLEEYLSKAVEHYSVANKYLQINKSTPIWQNVAWKNKIYEKIFTTHFNHNVQIGFIKSFLENLNNYHTEQWALQIINQDLINDHVGAYNFFETFKNDKNALWKNDPWVTDALVKAEQILKEQENFQDQDENQAKEYYDSDTKGFSEHDFYENDPNLFTPEQAHLATVLAEVMQGKADINKLQELGLNKDAMKALNKINETIDRLYKDLFLSGLKFYPEITEEEKLAFTEPAKSPIKITPLINNIRAFVARYITQTVEGNIQHLNSEIKKLELTIDQIIGEGMNRYLKINEVDIPLYDKLYEEFDAWREAGRYPLEVYLGRDGVYAYIGRRAQDTARRWKLGAKKRKLLREAGEVLEITPKYLVYPRYFRDNLSYETKREFLEQERISKDADPLFYDTGYTGTIPEQIMEIMDFEPEEIENRIRLLSAQSAQRRVKGIPENARSEIIEYIENNAKTEESAKGLIIDKKTGKICHIAKPTTPEEQFYFMMIKQAISRHYWFKEMMYHEPTGNINLDSEHYTLRIRKEYLDQLPEEFIKNAREYLSQHGEILKSSKGQGEYPNEEIILFKLKDDTEIIAKKIELRKSKEARQEFAILISAKKHNLKTAEPVGFLTGKTEKDGGYLLMGKIEGISGRKFEKQLRESGKYTEDQIKSIMQSVIEKNQEMAEFFREKLNIDKHWRIKDTIIQFNEETGKVEEVIPIDWERVQTYDPDNPKDVDAI